MMKWTRTTEDSISIRTPAKLNLFLEVLGKRADGFHDLQTFITSIDRFDQIDFSISASGRLELVSRWDEALVKDTGATDLWGDLPSDHRNLVYRAAELFRERCRIDQGLRIELVKTIPSQAGLGGASGNAAGTLIALNELFQAGVPEDTLRNWSAELGSDIPFFIGDGPAICEGRGEKIRRLISMPELNFVVVKPEFGLSTQAIFSNLNLVESHRVLPSDNDLAGDFDWSVHLFNRLQEAAEIAFPAISQICVDLIKLGCKAAMMTGSGSCCFGICDNRSQAIEIAGAYSRVKSGFAFVCRNL